LFRVYVAGEGAPKISRLFPADELQRDT